MLCTPCHVLQCQALLFRESGRHPTVEQLWLDERKVAVYDLLENYCEFIIINLPYIRRHKDCPNDINEAVSSLIFASARLGDLPELRRFASSFEEEKYSLVDEIALLLSARPLLLEFDAIADESVNEISNAAADYKEDGQLRLKDPKITDKKLLKDPSDSHQQLPTANSTCLSTTKTIKDSENCLKHNGNYGVLDSECQEAERGILKPIRSKTKRRAAESSTEDSAELPEQMIYLDDI
ncbi:hypothetical protein HAX54_002023 [Datura stramonium]|uniref:Uncharacterized protein n=1 Tax=Datura stramonium TaxID=4076 RepID=A0ABS8T436_DATST|nr:hypothetical protein [Datura stramonium]